MLSLQLEDLQEKYGIHRCQETTRKKIGFNRLGNQDTMQRFIYIHGTNDLSRLGKPVSHGCIRMDNQDIIDLFEEINIGDHVLINEI